LIDFKSQSVVVCEKDVRTSTGDASAVRVTLVTVPVLLVMSSHNICQNEAAIVIVSADVHDEEECSIGGKVGLLLGNNCFAVMTSSGLSWYKAVSHCVSLGASLANAVDIHSKQSLSQLADYLSLSGLDGQPLWIGLNRRPWAWVQSFDPSKNHHLSSFFIIAMIITNTKHL